MDKKYTEVSDALTDPNEKNQYYYYADGDMIYKTCITTGEVLARSPRYEDALIEGGVLAPKFSVTGKAPAWTYSPVYADLICQQIMQGKSFKKVCDMPGMPPYHAIARWRAQHPEFEEQLQFARKMRADLLADDIMESVEESISKDEVPAEKLRFDKLKWLADKSNPEQYGNRTATVAESAPTQIIINTGIDSPSITKRYTDIETKDYEEINDEQAKRENSDG